MLLNQVYNVTSFFTGQMLGFHFYLQIGHTLLVFFGSIE